MTAKQLALLAAAGSAALLCGAFLFQWLGWAPCAMCLWQRWPHAAAVLVGALVLALPLAWVMLAGSLAAATTAALGLYHSGVERDWWEGPASCTSAGTDLTGLSGADLLATDGPALVLCDTFTPFLFGLTMANWNTLLSLGLAALWLIAAQKSRA